MSPACTAVAMACVFVLCAFDMAGSDFGLPDVVTTKRLGLLLLTAVYLLQRRSRLGVGSRYVLMNAAAVFFVAVWAFLSAAINDLAWGRMILSFMTWAMIAYATVLFNSIIPAVIREKRQLFLATVSVLAGATVVATLLWLFKTAGLGVFLSRFALRTTIDSLSCGNSRYMNGLFFVMVFPVAAVLGFIRVRPLIRGVSGTGVLLFVLLVLQEGSRQTAGALVLFVLSNLVLTLFLGQPVVRSVKWRKRSRIIIRAMVALFLIGMPVAYVFISREYQYELYRAFVERTQYHLETDRQGRLQVAQDAFRTACANPLFGVGDFHEAGPKWNTLGKHTHNGYANLMANYGLVPFVVLLVSIAWSLWRGFTLRRRAYENRDIWLVSYSFLVVHLVWSVNLNDILQEYSLFYMLALMFSALAAHPALPPEEHGPLQTQPRMGGSP